MNHYQPLSLNNLETVGNLQKAIAFKEKHYRECREKTEELLKGTGVTGDRWKTIVKAIETGQDPQKVRSIRVATPERHS